MAECESSDNDSIERMDCWDGGMSAFTDFSVALDDESCEFVWPPKMSADVEFAAKISTYIKSQTPDKICDAVEYYISPHSGIGGHQSCLNDLRQKSGKCADCLIQLTFDCLISHVIAGTADVMFEDFFESTRNDPAADDSTSILRGCMWEYAISITAALIAFERKHSMRTISASCYDPAGRIRYIEDHISRS
jgi:hypothetical protein